jgi:hypothetical protein
VILTRRSWINDERGQALVFVIGLVVVVLLLGLAAITYAINATSETTQDQGTRGAQQAADAGIQSQLYISGNSGGNGYDFTGGTGGLGRLLDCVVPNVNNQGVTIGDVSVAVSSSGVCPRQCVTVANGVCTPPSVSSWNAVGNEEYDEFEFLPNSVSAGSCSSSSNDCDAVQFPEILSVGCHTAASDATLSASDSPSSVCDGTGSSTIRRSYSKEMAILDPTAALQAVEATNDVTLNSEVTELGSQPGLAALLNAFEATVPLGGQYSNGNLAGLAVIDGDLNAGHNLNLPNTTVDLNSTSNSLASSVANVLGTLLRLQSPLAPGGSLSATFEYGNNACAWNQQSSTSAWVSSCTSTPNSTMPVTALGATYVQTKDGQCTLSTPVSERNQCRLQRPTVDISGSVFSGATCTAAITSDCVTYSGTTPTTPYSASTGDMTLTTGDVQFAPGSYVLCSLGATGTATVSDTANGGVQIYVLPPTASPCKSDTSRYQGSFIAVDGVDNLLLGAVNGSTSATSLLDPSGFQIYVEGDPSHTLSPAGSSAGTTPVQLSTGGGFDGYYDCLNTYGINTTAASPSASNACSDDPDTGVYIGSAYGSSPLGGITNPDEALIVYAPQSEVVLNTGLAFEGSLIGFNVDATALALLQDLSVANDSLSSAAQGLQVSQTLQCPAPSGGPQSTVSDTYGCG